AKREPATSLVDLHRRNSEIGKNSGRRMLAGGIERTIEVGEISGMKNHAAAETRQSRPRDLDRFRIAIDRQEPESRIGLEQRLRMPSGARRRVHEESRAGREDFDRLAEENGNV